MKIGHRVRVVDTVLEYRNKRGTVVELAYYQRPVVLLDSGESKTFFQDMLYILSEIECLAEGYVQ